MKTKYQNPILPGYADPDVYLENGVYYLYATSYRYDVWTSTDLVHWEKKPATAITAPVWGMDDWHWAPDVKRLPDGRLLMAASVHEHLGLLTATSPEGPFLPEADFLFDCSIDGHIFVDDDGTIYFYYVSWRKDHRYGLYGCILDPATLRPVEGSERPIIYPEAPYECQQAPVAEAPYMLKLGSKYILTYSGSHYESPFYCVAALRSDHPLEGFVRDETNPILVGNTTEISGCGHHCITTAPFGELALLYHTHHAPGTIHPRDLSIDPLYWDGQHLTCPGPRKTGEI